MDLPRPEAVISSVPLEFTAAGLAKLVALTICNTPPLTVVLPV